MIFIQTHEAGGDGTAPYNIVLEKDYTVDELVKEVLAERSNEWGVFYIKRGMHEYDKVLYRMGVLLSSMSEETRGYVVAEVKAAGGWGNMDYFIKIK